MKKKKKILKYEAFGKCKIGTLGFVYGLVMLLLLGSVAMVSVFQFHMLSGTNLSSYAEKSNIVTKTLKASRGNIYDRDNVVIATDMQTYDIICYLNSSRTKSGGIPAYVTDPYNTAKVLSKYLDIDIDTLYSYLTPTDGRTQTELGSKGRGLTKEVKEAVENESLPGVEFTESITRYYPLNDFASYSVGFAQTDDTGILTGKMGVEKYLNSSLTGINGSRTYQADKAGYVLPGMYYDENQEVNGNNVYLTIDQEIQEALQDSFKITEETFNAYHVWGAVMEVDTGKILAIGQTPSFNPNTKEIQEYTSYISQVPYEAGSVMKVFTYAAAIESGNYDGSAKVDSSTFCYSASAKNPYRVACGSGKSLGAVNNSSNKNWGMIPYDDGLKYSSNVVTSSIVTSVITPTILKQKLYDFGFFQTVDTEGMDEVNGVLNFEWPSEKLALSYGQGSTVTTLQIMQAFTAILGDGTMVKPYFIDKITDPYTGNTISETEIEVTGNPISETTAKKVQELMYEVANSEDGTARHYKIDEISILAKTGTSQVAINGNYNSGVTIASVAIGFPAEDPEYFVYYAFEADYDYNAHYKTEHVKSLLRKILQIEGKNNQTLTVQSTNNIIVAEDNSKEMIGLINHSVNYALPKLENYNVFVLGDGVQIVEQYPLQGTTVYDGDVILLLTNNENIEIPDFTGWSRKQLLGFVGITGVDVDIDGYGYVISQSCEAGEIVSKGDKVKVYLSEAIQKQGLD